MHESFQVIFRVHKPHGFCLRRVLPLGAKTVPFLSATRKAMDTRKNGQKFPLWDTSLRQVRQVRIWLRTMMMMVRSSRCISNRRLSFQIFNLKYVVESTVGGLYDLQACSRPKCATVLHAVSGGAAWYGVVSVTIRLIFYLTGHKKMATMTRHPHMSD
jgi:hypothetical protein